ncbi:MAG: hypothetical protein ACLQBK_20810 [Candidatus Sulfotelmatobacter sp.]
MQRMFWKLFAFLLLMTLAAYGQQQSLADIARQYREKRDAEQAAGTAPKLYTNNDLPPAQQVGTPEPVDETQPTARRVFDDRPTGQPAGERGYAEHRAAVEWRNRIQAQESRLADLQAHIDQFSSMVHSREGSAQYEGPYTRNQARAMQRLDQMQQSLDWQKQRLEQMQDAARHAGMHSAVYEP